MTKKRNIILFLMVLTIVVSGSISVQTQEYDMGGATVTFVGGGDLEAKMAEGWFGAPPRYDGILEDAEEKFNCKIEQLDVSYNEIGETALSRMMSGDSDYDIWVPWHYDYWSLAIQGALHPLDDIIDYDQRTSEKAIAESLRVDENLYSFVEQIIPLRTKFVLWNKELFEEEGLTTPQELYEADEWTFDEAKEIHEQLTKDTTGDGEYDQFGWAHMRMEYSIDPFLYGHDTHIVQRRDGKVEFTMNESETLEAINDWYDHYGDFDEITTSIADGQELFAQNRAGIFLERAQKPIKQTDMDHSAYGVVPQPKVSEDQEEYVFGYRAMNPWTIPVTAEQPEALVALVDFLFNEEWKESLIDEQVKEYAPDPESAEVIKKAMDYFDDNPPNIIYTVIKDAYWDYLPAILEGELSPKEAAEEWKPDAQSTLDEVFNQ